MANEEEESTSSHIKVGENCPKCGAAYTTPVSHFCRPVKDGEDDQLVEKTHADNIRAAVDNLNELVRIAVGASGLSTEYDISEGHHRTLGDRPDVKCPQIHVKIVKPV